MQAIIPPGKKVYWCPQMRVYGDIRELTLAVGNMGTADSGSPPMHKTR